MMKIATIAITNVIGPIGESARAECDHGDGLFWRKNHAVSTPKFRKIE